MKVVVAIDSFKGSATSAELNQAVKTAVFTVFPKFNVETFETVNNIVNTSGWAYFEKQVAAKTEMEIIFIKDGKANRLMTEKVIRPDVTSYFKNDFNVDNCGFKSTYDISKLESGKHQLAIYLVDKETKKEGLVLTDKYVTKP